MLLRAFLVGVCAYKMTLLYTQVQHTNLVIYRDYIKWLKALYLKEATDWLSWMVLPSMLFNTALLYLCNLLLTHKSFRGTYSLFVWLDLVSWDETDDTRLNMSDIYGGFKPLSVL